MSQESNNASLALFKEISRSYARFHLFFMILGTVELTSFLLFFSFFLTSSLIAFALAAIVFTVFSYFVLLFYFQIRKPELLQKLPDQFLYERQDSEKKKENLHELIASFQQEPFRAYSLKSPPDSPLLEKFSLLLHWQDLLQIQEMLFTILEKEEIQKIQLDPLNPEPHKALGKLYLQMAKLYQKPQSWAFIPQAFDTEKMREKEKELLEKALCEWQLNKELSFDKKESVLERAQIFSMLGSIPEESREYELLCQLFPDETAYLVRLGILYLKQRKKSEALQIYKRLNKDEAAIQELLSHYI